VGSVGVQLEWSRGPQELEIEVINEVILKPTSDVGSNPTRDMHILLLLSPAT
jgi:hypothetical protein